MGTLEAQLIGTHVTVDAKQRERWIFFRLCFQIIKERVVEWGRESLRFPVYALISPLICRALRGPRALQLHGFNSKASLKVEISKTDFVQFLQQA